MRTKITLVISDSILHNWQDSCSQCEVLNRAINQARVDAGLNEEASVLFCQKCCDEIENSSNEDNSNSKELK